MLEQEVCSLSELNLTLKARGEEEGLAHQGPLMLLRQAFVPEPLCHALMRSFSEGKENNAPRQEMEHRDECGASEGSTVLLQNRPARMELGGEMTPGWGIGTCQV